MAETNHSTAGDGPPDVTVVVASVESGHTMKASLDALGRACRDITHEILVVDASRDDSALIAEAHPDCDRVIDFPPETLVPILWGAGINESRGRWVAITTGHCVVPDGWASALIAELEAGAGAAGAGLLPLATANGLDCAITFLRYGRYFGLTGGEPRSVDDVPGDNAMYGGDSIREFVERNPHGFWEIEYHEELIAAGLELRVAPAATAGFGRSFPLATIVRHRFQHGQHCGAMRAAQMSKARVVLPSPLVPGVLLARAARAAWPYPELRPGLVRSIPTFLVLAGAWAAGEAVGALRDSS